MSLQGVTEAKLGQVGSRVRGEKKIRSVGSNIFSDSALKLCASTTTAGIRIPAREGAIWVGNVMGRGGGGGFRAKLRMRADTTIMTSPLSTSHLVMNAWHGRMQSRAISGGVG